MKWKNQKPMFREWAFFSTVLLGMFLVVGCEPPTATVAKNAIKGVFPGGPGLNPGVGGGCVCNQHCEFEGTGCTDVPGATINYNGVDYPVGCFCSCTARTTSGVCTWDNSVYETKAVNVVSFEED